MLEWAPGIPIQDETQDKAPDIIDEDELALKLMVMKMENKKIRISKV